MSNLTSDQTHKLLDLLDGMRTTMMTTSHDGQMRSRPMATMKADLDGTLWFMSSRSSEKAAELQSDSTVNLAYADETKHRYISVSGTATLVDDQAKKNELWTEMAKVWFDGPEDSDLVLVRVVPTGVEYWDTPGGKMVAFAGWVKALLTGDDDSMAETGSFGGK